MYLLPRTLPKLMSPLLETNSCVGIFSNVKFTVLEIFRPCHHKVFHVSLPESSPVAASHCEPANHAVSVKAYVRPVRGNPQTQKKHLDRVTKSKFTFMGNVRKIFDLSGHSSFRFSHAGFVALLGGFSSLIISDTKIKAYTVYIASSAHTDYTV